MQRRLSKHVEVNICEFGKRWCVPETYSFLKSEVWDQGPFPTPPSDLSVTVVNGTGQAIPLPSAMATLCSAIVVFLLQSGQQRAGPSAFATSTPRTPTTCRTKRSLGTTSPPTCATGGSLTGGGRVATLQTCQPFGSDGGRVREATPSRGPKQVLDSCAQAQPGVCTSRPETWGACRVELGSMHVVPPDRADPQDGDLQDGGMELRDDLPQAGLCDPDGQEGREVGEEEGAFPTDSFHTDELDATTSTPEDGQRAPNGRASGDGNWESEWTEVIGEFYKNGGYNPEVTHQRPPQPGARSA